MPPPSTRDSPRDVLLEHAGRTIRTILSQLDYGMGETSFDLMTFRFDWVINMLCRASESLQIPDSLINKLLQANNVLIQVDPGNTITGYHPGKCFTGTRGRPRYDIPKEQIELYLQYGFTQQKIAEMLHVSAKTLGRRIKEYGIELSSFTDLTDTQLDEMISSILDTFPNCGSKRMSGFLLARGIRVQQARLREAMRRTDPEGVLLRSLQLRIISRRKYSVECPLALWHMDGNQKLIRYV